MVSDRRKSADNGVRSERGVSPSPSACLPVKVSGLNQESEQNPLEWQIRFKLSSFRTLPVLVVNRLGGLFCRFLLQYFPSF